MSKNKITYLLSFIPNPRFNKRINAAKNEFDVSIVCWEKTDKWTFRVAQDIADCHVIHVEANAFDPVERIKPLITFSREAISCLQKIKPDVIHLQGLDMLLIACWYKTRCDHNVRIIYEVADLHRLLVDDQNGMKRKLISKGVAYFERHCASKVDRLIVTSEKYFDVCYSKFYSPDKVVYIPNAPFKKFFDGYTPKKHEGDFVVGFIGGIRYINEIKLLISASERAGVKVFLAGAEVGDEIKEISKTKPHVEYFGAYDYDSQIAELYSKCDAINSVYPAHMKNVKVALPNKLYESVICGLPLIVAKDTYVGELVESWGVGVTVPYDSEEALAAALVELSKFGSLYNNLSDAARKKAPEVELDRYLDGYIEELRMLCR